jgi:predicted metal-dependent enzyme (double-stranded beta helix superfamily)
VREVVVENAYTLKEFISDVDRITREEHEPASVTERITPLLQRLLQNPGEIPHDFWKRGPDRQGRYMVHRAPNFNVTTVVWGPGDGAPPHNHETWGLIGVLENEIQETRFRRLDDQSVPGRAVVEVKQVLRNRAGMVSYLVPPDDEIHQMQNVTDRNTVEIHVYGRDLADFPRLRFDPEKQTTASFSTPKYDNC